MQGFIAPEVYEGNYNHKSDWWSVGVILHLLLTGKFPVTGLPNQMQERTKNFKFNMNSKILSGLSYAARDFLSNLLQTDPDDRMSHNVL